MAFPVAARYPFRFRHGDTGLTPSFTFFKRLDTFAGVSQPSIIELQSGVYYFDFTFTTAASPDIIFEIDGGVTLPTEVRFISEVISVKDYFLDDLKGASNIDNTQLNTAIAAVGSSTSTIAGAITKMLGLMHENSVLDQTVFDGGNNLTVARLRLYDSKTNALAATGTGLLFTYTVTATYTGDNLQTYTVVLEP